MDSSFIMWRNVQQAFMEHTIINRGLGGATVYLFSFAKVHRQKKIVYP